MNNAAKYAMLCVHLRQSLSKPICLGCGKEWHMANQKGLDRLDKAVSAQTSLSRKDVHRLLSRGQILVNGVPARNFDTRVDQEKDEIIVEGRPLSLRRYSYLMMNKPRGVVSATSDAALSTVLDLVPEELRRSGLFPAGRLDKDTTGFVLLTNDGEFSHRILAPKSHVPKTYIAELDEPVGDDVVRAFLEGVEMAPDKRDVNGRDGPARRAQTVCMPASLELLDVQRKTARVELRQGMYHQVKRMFAAFGLTVMALHRERIGGLTLDPSLAPGECRALNADEVALITLEYEK